jgi:DNA-directed RNA polymerase specialized sigma24 family protein
MKKKQFYSHLVETDTLLIELDKLEMTEDEKVHLVSLIDSNIHHAIVDVVLSELSSEDKKIFLTHVLSEEHDKIWELLDKKVDNIEDKIQQAADSLKKELHKDIEEIKEEEG